MLFFPRWKVGLIIATFALGMLIALPNVIGRATLEGLPSWLPARQVLLGLDLQGGSHLLLEVEVEAVIAERLDAMVDEIRLAMRKADIGYVGLGVRGDAVTFTLREPAHAEQTKEELAALDADCDVVVGEDGVASITLNEAAVTARRHAAVEQSIEIVRRRIDETGTREPTIQRQGESRILIQLPGVDDPERIKGLLGKTAKLTFRLLDPTVTPGQAAAGQLPVGSELLPSDDDLDAEGNPQMLVVRKRAMVGGDSLVDAQPTFQQGQPVVSFQFDSAGARRFGDATTKNTGQRMAIVLDGRVISAPVIREPITGGRGIISGSFTVQSATDLALLLRAGALPAPLTIVEERSVGPGLGADSIRAGITASIIAVILVVVFMLVFYGFFGVIANIALLVNGILLLAAMTLLQATLTLPGIAGIALTLGMAVDANVLIYERIREEIALGRTPISAIEAGYSRAMATIIDSNLTTLIAGLLMFGLGSGAVKGFGVTLSIGLATSMFTAVTFSRLIVATWLRRARPKSLPI
ncbi:MAG: protein translocase subunit SecD [Alphaproteobacteria bacterium]|nr:protein translocase subunit SecD [Alphaproteobacteria bacterium]